MSATPQVTKPSRFEPHCFLHFHTLQGDTTYIPYEMNGQWWVDGMLIGHAAARMLTTCKTLGQSVVVSASGPEHIILTVDKGRMQGVSNHG